MNKNMLVMLRSCFINIFLIIIKVVIGFVGHSKALIADGIHSASDLATDIVAIVCSFLSDKKEDKEHPYGHGKIEYLCCIFISVLVVILGSNLIINAFKGEKVIVSTMVIYATILTVLLKYFLSSYILRKGYEYKSSILLTSGKESRMDVLSSFIVLIASILSQFGSKYSFLAYSDIIATFILGIFICWGGFKMLYENMTLILGQHETDENILSKVENIITEYPDVLDYSDLNMIEFGSYYKCDLTIYLEPNMSIKEANVILNSLRRKLISKKTGIKYLNVSIKPVKK